MRIGILIYFSGNGVYYFDNWNEVTREFKPSIDVSGVPIEDWKGLNVDSAFIVKYDDANQTTKFLARLDPLADKGTIRQAITYALAGKFDKLDDEKSKTIWKGGDPSSSNGIFEGASLDLPWPQIGLGDIWEAIKNLSSFNWVPWWALAAVSTVSTIKATRSKTMVGQSLYGVLSAYTAFKAIKKYNSK